MEGDLCDRSERGSKLRSNRERREEAKGVSSVKCVCV